MVTARVHVRMIKVVGEAYRFLNLFSIYNSFHSNSGFIAPYDLVVK